MGIDAKEKTAQSTSVGADERPVSYTHLDVYKRQVRNLHEIIRDIRASSKPHTIQGGARKIRRNTPTENSNADNTMANSSCKYVGNHAAIPKAVR